MLPFHYLEALYRRNNFGEPCFWDANVIGENSLRIYHGILGKHIHSDTIKCSRHAADEYTTRVAKKRKAGYKYLRELKDNVDLPVEKSLLSYLEAYLPTDYTNADGAMLPMLAKTFNNVKSDIFKKCSVYYGQYKINGLRCFISAEYNHEDMFKPFKLIFRSREGTVWNTLNNLEEYLLSIIEQSFIVEMVEGHYILDGEVYLPNHTVNEIDHFVKDPNCLENKLLQYWCYDIAIPDMIQVERYNMLINKSKLDTYLKFFTDKNAHYNNKELFVVLPTVSIVSKEDATRVRDCFIDSGFEGLILRNPYAEYQYGKRNTSMLKFKKSTDGKFTIVDIYPEGIKRKNIPLFLLRNDINNATFEVHLGGSQTYQSTFLDEDTKRKTIGKKMFVEYGERSGVNQVPFHVKTTYIL